MLEKIKEVPFIDESKAVKLTTKEGKLILERNDRVVWGYEKTALSANEINCYVEADKFFELLSEIETMEQDTCLKLTLKNKAKYELPFLSVEWESQEMPVEYTDTITFKIDDLILCTLKNLVKPELQCIYIDNEGAVSCDFLSACVSETVKSTEPFLLPADVQELITGRLCKVKVTEDKLYFEANDFGIVTTKPTHANDGEWWNDIRGLVSGADEFKLSAALLPSLRRLQMFADYVTFNGEKATAGSNFEPFQFYNLENREYEIERLSKLLTTATKMTQANGNILLANEKSTFLLSPMEEA